MPPRTTDSAPAERDAFDLDRHVFYWMTQVISRRDEQLAPALRELGLRVPEWRCLGGVHARGFCTMSELADIASIDRTTLSRTIERMVRAGWMTRIADGADARVVRVRLTASGRRLFERVVVVVEKLNRAATADLPDGAVDLLRWTLARMKQNLDAQLPAADATRGERSNAA